MVKNKRPPQLTAGYRSLFSRIGFKLIVLILCVLIQSMGSLAYLATELMVEFGEYSVGINEKHNPGKNHPVPFPNYGRTDQTL